MAVGLLGGCGADFPNFHRYNLLNNAYYLYHVPADKVVEQVRLEVSCFFTHQSLKDQFAKDQILLDQYIDKTVDVELTLKTDSSYNVGYEGLDLERTPFGALAELIKVKSGEPAFGVKLDLKPAVSAKLKFKIDAGGPCPADQKIGKSHLYLKDWMVAYFERNKDPTKSLEEITLSTDFAFAVGFKAGVNPFFSPTHFILPITGLTLEYKPNFSHALQLKFKVCAKEKCKPKPPNNQIAAEAKKFAKAVEEIIRKEKP